MGYMGLRLQHEDGTAISELGAGGDELFRALPWRDAVDYPYLRYVEPYGDTYFNSLQMSAVLPELRRLAHANNTCPYCSAALDPLPKAKKKCPSCAQPIYVRSAPDGMTYLLQEVDLPVIEQAWAERRVGLTLLDDTPLRSRAYPPSPTRGDPQRNHAVSWF